MTGTAAAARVGFREWTGGEPAVTATAPGRVNLIGGHVDYNDGIVLPVAIDRTTAVATRPRDDGTVRVRSDTVGETVEVPLGTLPDGWAAYVVGTAAVLGETTGQTLGADLFVASDVPLGAGLSSSAALEVAVAGALNATYDLGQSPEALADVAWRAETERVGMNCGIMDQLTSACGQAGHALRIDCRSRETEPIPVDADAVELVVLDTTVSHELADSAFNDRVAECQEAVSRLDTVLDRTVTSLRDVTPAEVTAHRGTLGQPYASRAAHVTTEIRRVEEAVETLRTGEFDRLGALLEASHRSLADAYDVSSPELDAAVDALVSQDGVYGARMVGGGFGGSVVGLVAPATVDAVVTAATDAYAAATGIEPEVYRAGVGDGLRVAGG